MLRQREKLSTELVAMTDRELNGWQADRRTDCTRSIVYLTDVGLTKMQHSAENSAEVYCGTVGHYTLSCQLV